MKKYFRGKRVVIFGSAPSALNNSARNIDKYDVIVRVNNYKTKGFELKVGSRTDVHYAFYGTSVRKTAEELKEDGVYLCMCKCPDAKVLDHHKMVTFDSQNLGGDFRYIYKNRKNFWFTKTYVPEKLELEIIMSRLDGHMPTTGFAAIMTIMEANPKELYITGFDGFTSKLHNINEPWRDKSERIDPTCHNPDKELDYLKEMSRANKNVVLDVTLENLVGRRRYGYQEIINQYHKIYLQESEEGKVYGRSSESMLHFIAELIRKKNPKTILDYGCGRSGLVNYFWNDGARVVFKYDPAIREFRHKPKGAMDMVLCTDVLEHIPEDHVTNILSDIRTIASDAFFSISLVRARRFLPNGLNAHITIKPSEWWIKKIKDNFREIDILKEDDRELYIKTW